MLTPKSGNQSKNSSLDPSALHETIFVVLDLETTGASPKDGSGITEIGAIKVCGGKVLGEFSSFVNPMVPIPQYITNLTGITDQMLANAPEIAEIFPQLMEFLAPHDQVQIVAHNAPFDIGFLKAAAGQLTLPWPNFEVIDTVRLARLVIDSSEVFNYRLSTLSQFFQTTTPPTHRALDDVKTTVEVMHHLFERLSGFGVFTSGELKEFMKSRPGNRIRP